MLDKHGFARETLGDWVCLVQRESAFKQFVIGGPNKNKSYDWGLFQINDQYWCKVGGVGNDCNMDCYDLLDDDETDDIACVRLVFARHGFIAWHGWEDYCQPPNSLPNTDECFL